jgi:hypothetical protein
MNLAADPVLAKAVAVEKVACLWLHNERARLMTRDQIRQKLEAMKPEDREVMRAALNRNKNKFRCVA